MFAYEKHFILARQEKRHLIWFFPSFDSSSGVNFTNLLEKAQIRWHGSHYFVPFNFSNK